MAWGPRIARTAASALVIGVLTVFAATGVSAGAAHAEDAPAPASERGSLSAIGSVHASRSDANAFSFDSFDADYRLGRDKDDRATLTTTEKLVAEFPQTDQNHGIQRVIPNNLHGHPIHLKILSVTDGAGKARAFSSADDDDDSNLTSLTIADDSFVHGRQTYVIRYSQHNVILYPDNANDEQFYWDVNGTGWAQKFGTVTGRLHVPASLEARLTKQTACFQGVQRSKTPCGGITSAAESGGTVITASATDLGARQNLTMVVGFTHGTFTPRDDAFFSSPVSWPLIGTSVLALLGLIGAAVLRATRWRNAPGRPTIIAEYQPPRGMDLLMSSRLAKGAKRAQPAAALDLAVRGIVRVVQINDSEKHPEFELELLRVDGLSETDAALVHAVFGTAPGVGAKQNMKKPKPPIGPKLAKLFAKLPKRAISEGLERRTRGPLKTVLWIGAIVFMIASIALAATMLSQALGAGLPFLILMTGMGLGVLTLVLVFGAHPLTATGAEARDHLAGLRLYIELAEEDRMRMLQSPQGALRTPVGSTPVGAPAAAPLSNEQVLKLTEKLLPYAVLFGRDKERMRALSALYERADQTPDWYSGSGPFQAAYFAASIGAFSATSSTWAGSGSSSSSSGFGGGGFSGGGGGGGGGGGV